MTIDKTLKTPTSNKSFTCTTRQGLIPTTNHKKGRHETTAIAKAKMGLAMALETP
jgi:hypothetical protein